MEFDRIECTATVENLAALTEFVEAAAERCGLEARKSFGVLVALEEAFVNICSHAYSDGPGPVEVACGADGEAFVLEISDNGTAFDLLSLPEPDTTSDILDRQIGGLGVHFIRTLSDSVSYRREKGRNILRMLFNL